jgi:hypothetical protein
MRENAHLRYFDMEGTAAMSLTMSHIDALENYLTERYGLFLTGRALWKAIGFQSGSAFRKAASRGALPIPTFRIDGRKGLFAYTSDVAKWASAVGARTAAPGENEEALPVVSQD